MTTNPDSATSVVLDQCEEDFFKLVGRSHSLLGDILPANPAKRVKLGPLHIERVRFMLPELQAHPKSDNFYHNLRDKRGQFRRTRSGKQILNAEERKQRVKVIESLYDDHAASPSPQEGVECVLCPSSTAKSKEVGRFLGPSLQNGGSGSPNPYYFHDQCLFWSSDVYTTDGSVKKSSGQICKECLEPRASVECARENCEKIYHFACLSKASCSVNAVQSKMHCVDHREIQESESAATAKPSETTQGNSQMRASTNTARADTPSFPRVTNPAPGGTVPPGHAPALVWYVESAVTGQKYAYISPTAEAPAVQATPESPKARANTTGSMTLRPADRRTIQKAAHDMAAAKQPQPVQATPTVEANTGKSMTQSSAASKSGTGQVPASAGASPVEQASGRRGTPTSLMPKQQPSHSSRAQRAAAEVAATKSRADASSTEVDFPGKNSLTAGEGEAPDTSSEESTRSL
ncbi:hypothetical protein NDN08_008136 [Rhodosorus marinus]|uniref:Zinc finger PHD-type domain-containing protein n=1 Tax=Rhodosorus marinus TaxID=101924 RepID=A0AAV8UZW1_9RHOD|nr:hypothetical protein NDN08_008136 [Rhodosorus marinus]